MDEEIAELARRSQQALATDWRLIEIEFEYSCASR